MPDSESTAPRKDWLKAAAAAGTKLQIPDADRRTVALGDGPEAHKVKVPVSSTGYIFPDKDALPYGIRHESVLHPRLFVYQMP
ncbi:hypothetical protein N7540_002196 [Penicillium herquei]|nr:hypothetical protein N7540_002196 [Penicillium herquei]